MNSHFRYALPAFAFLASHLAGAAEVLPMPIPAGSGSSLPRLVGDTRGSVYLSWVSQRGDMSSLVFSKLVDGVWKPPQSVSTGDDWFINWADFPSLAVNEDTMAAHWLQLNAGGFYNYDVKAAFYDAASQTWGQAITVNRDGVSAEHGFVSMLPLSAGRTFIAWLDGRHTREEPGTVSPDANDDGHDTDGAMSLRAGIYDRKGETLDEWELDGRVCDCCQTGAALAASGPIVVYRDRSSDEIRDIHITRLIDRHWSRPAAVHHDDWQIAGCPVNGPAVAARGRHVAVVWFSAKNEAPEVKLALSRDSGATFSEPVMISKDMPIGRVGAAYLDSGNIALSWMDTRGESARLMVALYDAEGRFLDSTQVADTSASPQSGFPVIASSGDEVYVAWTDVSGDPEVRVARIRF